MRRFRDKLIAFLLVLAPLSANEAEFLQRIQNHGLIGDWELAVKEARLAIERYPVCPELQGAYVRALARGGQISEAIEACHQFTQRFGQDESLLEELSFCILEHAWHSHSLQTRLFALVGGAFSQDIRGVQGVHAGLKASNSHLRRVAVDLSAFLPDKKIRRRLIELLQEERQLDTRVAIIHSLGAQRAEESRRLLFKVAARSPRAEERAAAAEALGRIYEDYPPGDLRSLIESDRSSLRWLACRLAAHLAMKGLVPELRALTLDDQVDVRVAAWEALGVLREAAEAPPAGEHPRVCLAAAWARLLSGRGEAGDELTAFLDHSDKTLRREASMRLATTGGLGLSHCLSRLEAHQDPVVRINLALALIRQDRESQRAAASLFEGLEQCHGRLTWVQGPTMDGVVEQSTRPGSPGQALAEDHLARLRLMNILAMADHHEAKDRLRRFLRHRRFPLMGEAATQLMAEGEDVQGIELLLEEEDSQLRLRAALILALWSHDSRAVGILREGYAGADRRMKEIILEVLGRVGDRESLVFLQDCLSEPFQNLKVLAAASVVQVLSH